MTKIQIGKVVFDGSIYPRSKPSSAIIEEYADSLMGGAKFPPIVLESGTNRLLDGYHRWKAHLKWREGYQLSLNDDKPIAEPPDAIDAEFHVIPDGIPAKLYAAKMSSVHGHRLTPGECRDLAREIYIDNPGFSQDVIAEYVGRSQRSVSDYVKDLQAKKEESERTILLRLDKLGWTQEEIAQAMGITQRNVGQKLEKIAELLVFLKNRLDAGIPHVDIAEQTPLPLQLVWAIDLEGRTDKDRMSRLNINIQPYDVWNFGKCGDLFGSQHPGRIPGELIAHVLYFFTGPGAMVIDPMVGSGTTLDVCLAMGRKCYGFDIDARHERPDVIAHNISKDGWHERIKKADLIFWDPPYFNKMDNSTIGEDGYIEGSISKLPREDYLNFFSVRLAEARKLVKKGARLAFLMSDWDDDKGEQEGIFIWHYAKIIRDAGWNLTRHIQVPLSTQQVHPDIVNKFRESRRLARLERYLLIAEA
jgi:DNA modification methylase